MFRSIAELVTRRGWVVVLGWVAAAAALFFLAPSWGSVSQDDNVRFFPPGYPSVVGQALLERGFPEDTSGSRVVVIAERPGRAMSEADLAFADRLAGAFRRLGQARKDLGILLVVDRHAKNVGDRLVARGPDGGQIVLTAVLLRGTFSSKEARLAVNAVLEELDRLRPEAPEGLELAITGAAAVGRDSNTAANESVDATTVATVVLVIGILLIVYRSPLLALIPLASIALSAFVALRLIATMARPPFNFQVINVTQVFVIVVLFGAGTDYCLFLIARYREELARGKGRNAAISTAIRQVGGALVASAGTVILGLGMLWFSTFAKIQFTGPAIALSLAIALLSALTLAPVLLRIIGPAVFWPFRAPQHHAGGDPDEESLQETPMFGFWAKVADGVVRRPGLILLASLAVLAPFAWIGTQTRASYDMLGDLGPTQPSIVGTNLFRRYYPEGELSPSTVLIRHPEIDFTTRRGMDAIEALSRKLAALPGVVEVRSLTRPLGQPISLPASDEPSATATGPQDGGKPGGLLGQLGQFGQGLQRQIEEAQRKGARDAFLHYVSTGEPDPSKAGANEDRAATPEVAPEDRNHITRIDVVTGVSPFSEEAMETLRRVEAIVHEATGEGGALEGAEPGVAGTTVQIDDLKTVTTADERRMYVLVTLGVYAILVVLLRRPGICLYLIATVVLGYLASLGATELVFRALHHGPTPWMGLDWKVGFFLFVILVAVGEDYNIFLMSRVIEEERKHGPIEGTRRAVAHTGGIISSCGLIMAGTFLAMLSGSLTTLKELGFALGLGVLLDTFVVRPVLVPAFVVLWHRWRPRAELDGHGLPSDEAEHAATSASS
jgi:RND superfamily putative drug exporter